MTATEILIYVSLQMSVCLSLLADSPPTAGTGIKSLSFRSGLYNCSQLSSLRKVHLSSSDLEVLLKTQGGWLPQYSAIDPQGAARQFPNMLEVPDKDLLVKLQTSRTGQKQTNTNLLKSDIVGFLRKQPNATYDGLVLPRKTQTTKRRRRAGKTVTTTTTTDYCLKKGTHNQDNFVHLCAACMATTELLPGTFPKLINEVLCDDRDTACLKFGNVAHGSCQQQTLRINLLRRVDGMCRLAYQGTEQVAIDDWEVYTQPIRVGCKCMLHPDSYLKSAMSAG